MFHKKIAVISLINRIKVKVFKFFCLDVIFFDMVIFEFYK